MTVAPASLISLGRASVMQDANEERKNDDTANARHSIDDHEKSCHGDLRVQRADASSSRALSKGLPVAGGDRQRLCFSEGENQRGVARNARLTPAESMERPAISPASLMSLACSSRAV